LAHRHHDNNNFESKMRSADHRHPETPSRPT
jgi:hypothetical protein